jgi:ubiquinone/menaquinone biosynthesis C-methylase UbiE
VKSASIRKQWDDSAEAWADFVRRGKDYYRQELNNPGMFELLGDVSGKKILDLGCGEGCNSRIMARKGAKVVGIDFSKRIIDLAIQYERKRRLYIEYHVLDASNLQIFKNETFDIVTSFMALQDIEDYRGAVREVNRVLRRHGRFVFVIPHPCFETKKNRDGVVGGWQFFKDAQSRSKEKALYCKLDRYFRAYRYKIPWTMERLTKHFETTTFHRTLTHYADALYEAGLTISRLKEPKPTRKAIERHRVLKEHLSIPQSILIEALKP